MLSSPTSPANATATAVPLYHSVLMVHAIVNAQIIHIWISPISTAKLATPSVSHARSLPQTALPAPQASFSMQLAFHSVQKGIMQTIKAA